MLAVAGDALAEWQDSLHKGEVTEYEIFRRACACLGMFPLVLCGLVGRSIFHTKSAACRGGGFKSSFLLYQHMDMNCFACW